MKQDPVMPFRSDIIVELHVVDFQRAYNFYKLFGFALQWMEQGYMVLKNGSKVLCFYGGGSSVYDHEYFERFPKTSQPGYAVELILFIEELEAFYAEVRDSVNIVASLRLRPWGKKDFRVADPFGYYIRVSEPYDIVDATGKTETTSCAMRELNFVL